MLKKLSVVTASTLAIVLVFVSITYACSGVALMNPAAQQSPMDMGVGNPPCSKEKGDICKSVRDSLLSVKPSVSEVDNSHLTVGPAQLCTESPTLTAFSPLVPVSESAYHPVFKLPLSLSYLVLRI